MIEVVEIHHWEQSGWTLKKTDGGLTYFWTGYGWTMGASMPKLFETEKDAKTDIQLASGHVTGC